MSVELDPLTIVNQMRDLAAEPRHRRAMVEDQVLLFGLVYFLDYPNPQAVYSALLAVRYLAECRANRETMKGELGMMLNLQNVMQKSTSPEETKLLASEIYEILQLAGKEEAEQAEAAAASCQRKAQFFLGSNNKRAKTVVLHIEGLDDPALGTAINSTKVMIAQQEVKTEDGGEMILPFQEGSAVLVEENIDIPDYLPEEESPSQEQDKAVTDDMGWLCTAANFLTSFFYW